MPPDFDKIISERAPSDPSSISRVRDRLFGRPKRLAPPRYDVGELIGEGAFGRVYRAFDTELGRSVALKVVHHRSSAEEARIKREAEALAQLAHPNVVNVFDRGPADDGVYYIALEYIRGIRLDGWLRAQDRSLRELLEVFLQIARGLKAVHECGLIHRDFKPSNVIVGDDDGRVRVLDFGLAKRVNRESDDESVVGYTTGTFITQRGSFVSEVTISIDRCDGPPQTIDASATGNSCRARAVSLEGLHGHEGRQRCRELYLDLSLSERDRFAGTPAFAAPEQLSGSATDARSDIFSFCVVLFEAVYGFRPFPGSSRSQLEVQITAGEINAGAPVRRVPRWLEKLLRRGLSPLAVDRPQSFDHIIGTLERKLRSLEPFIAVAAGTAIAMLVVVAVISALRPAPVMLDTEWQSSRESRGELTERYGVGLSEQLDAYEQDWLEVSGTVDVEQGEPQVVECLRDLQGQFDDFVVRLVATKPAAEFAPLHASMLPSRLWLTDLLPPSHCTLDRDRRGDPERRNAITTLLESQAEQLQGHYERALELADEAGQAAPRVLGRLSGAVGFQRGYLQLQLENDAAWTTLTHAAQANDDDLEFFVETLAMQLLAGAHLDRPQADREEVALRLNEATDQLGEGQLRARAWSTFAQGQHLLLSDPSTAEIAFRQAGAHFRRAPSVVNQEVMTATADLQAANAMAMRGGPFVDAAEQALDSFQHLLELLGEDHRYIRNWRVDLALILQRAEPLDPRFGEPMRSLLEQTIALGDADGAQGFEAMRATAEQLFLDARRAHANGTAAGNTELLVRSIELQTTLRDHLHRLRPHEIGRVTQCIALTRLVSFPERRETLSAVQLWAEHAVNSDQRQQARDHLESLQSKKNDESQNNHQPPK